VGHRLAFVGDFMDISIHEVLEQDALWSKCDECGKWFSEGEKEINILFSDVRVTLCEKCFRKFVKKVKDFAKEDEHENRGEK